MSKETGGPAFPEIGNVAHNSDWQSEPGMTIRDYFAAKAMQAIIAGNGADECSLGLGAAKDAYAVADAMIAARNE